jgi:hypothetical protein
MRAQPLKSADPEDQNELMFGFKFERSKAMESSRMNFLRNNGQEAEGPSPHPLDHKQMRASERLKSTRVKNRC